jgi:hypothetical protein
LSYLDVGRKLSNKKPSLIKRLKVKSEEDTLTESNSLVNT